MMEPFSFFEDPYNTQPYFLNLLVQYEMSPYVYVKIELMEARLGVYVERGIT